MNKFNWVAQDKDGEIRIYENRPNAYENTSWWEKSRTISNVVAVTNRRNPNWKESLIDLSKNDYIIKDGILMATRKHAALIHAWADGAVIQYQNSDDKWTDVVRNDPSWRDEETYRIKPATKVVRFRNYDAGNGDIGVAYSSLGDTSAIKWVGDWQTAEVEIEL